MAKMSDREVQSLITTMVRDLTKKQMTNVWRQLADHIGTATVGQEDDWILLGIQSVLQERGLGHMIPPRFVINNNKSFKGYRTQADRVVQVLEQAVPDMTLVENRSLGAIAARCLADYISTWPIRAIDGTVIGYHEVALDSMLHNVGQIPKAIDRAFPGYLASGTLGFLLRHRQ